jgi:hypothetical protein
MRECIFCNTPFPSIDTLKEHSARCLSHPAVIAGHEYKEVAAIVCLDVDLLLDIASDKALTADELREQIQLVHEQKEQAIYQPSVRRSRYSAAAMLFGK